jgi:hypothetical protein
MPRQLEIAQVHQIKAEAGFVYYASFVQIYPKLAVVFFNIFLLIVVYNWLHSSYVSYLNCCVVVVLRLSVAFFSTPSTVTAVTSRRLLAIVPLGVTWTNQAPSSAARARYTIAMSVDTVPNESWEGFTSRQGSDYYEICMHFAISYLTIIQVRDY